MAAVPPITVPIKVEVSDLDTLRACVQHLQEAQERMVEATRATLALLDALRRPEPTLDATQVAVRRCEDTSVHEDHLHYPEAGSGKQPSWCDGNDPDVTQQQERVLKIPEGSTPEGVMASLLTKGMDTPLDTEILEGQPKPMPGAGRGPNASLVQGVGLVCPECAQGKRQNCTQVRVEVLDATLSGELDHRLALDSHLSSVKAHNEREAMALDRERRHYDAQADTLARLSQAYQDLQQQHQAALAETAMYRAMANPQGREPGHDVGPPPVQG